MREKLIFVRHAAPTAQGVCAGRTDIEVEAAAPSARSLLERLQIHRCERVVSSPSARCRDLATELAHRLELPLIVDDRLRELDFGEWEGLRWSDIEARDGERLARWMQHWELEPPPGGESLQELEQRARSFLATTDHALVITHAGFIRAAWVVACGWDWRRAMRTPVGYLEPLRIPGTQAQDP